MRTLKFRGKDHLGYWQHGVLHQRHDSVYIAAEDGICQIEQTNTIGQFTGMYDDVLTECGDDTHEIYEGDIIQLTPRNELGVRERRAVIWSDSLGAWCLRKGCSAQTIFALNGNNNLRVIGNIHDNPELLNN